MVNVDSETTPGVILFGGGGGVGRPKSLLYIDCWDLAATIASCLVVQL